MGKDISFNLGIPFQLQANIDHQQGFANTEVATRALKAVRYQKFNIHRRMRPEALAARLHKTEILKTSAPELLGMQQLQVPASQC